MNKLQELFEFAFNDASDEIDMTKLAVEDLITLPRPKLEVSESRFTHPAGYRGIVYYSKIGNGVIIERGEGVVFKGPRAFEYMFPSSGMLSFEVVEWLTLMNRFEQTVHGIERGLDNAK